jgi:aminoglycoside phosphotransferase (APT) family kinase protein
MQSVPGLLAAVGLSPQTVAITAGGRAGRTWKVITSDGPRTLRFAESPAAAASQLGAMKATRDIGLPVPTVDRCERIAGGVAMLLSWMPGETIHEMLRRNPASAPELGMVMGDAQRRLHQVDASAEVVAVAGWRRASPPEDMSAATLLHLDWHWRNILVEDHRLSGIIDWDNAHRGHRWLDLARTYTLLTVDPALVSLTNDERTTLAGLLSGWAAAYGPPASLIPPECLAWAGNVMLEEVAGRSESEPEPVTELKSWVASLERAKRSTS